MMRANEQTLADSRLLGDAHAWAKPAAMWIKYTLGVIIRTMRVIVYIENAHKCVKFRSYMSRTYIGEVMKKETEIEPAACETPREDAQMQVVHGAEASGEGGQGQLVYKADALGEGGQGRLAHKAEASGEGPQALPAYKVAATAEKAQVPAMHGVESGSLRSRKKAQSRHAIERAILELVIERGYENVIVEDVCQRAEVSKKTFFNYFSSKDAAIRGGFDAIPTPDDFTAALESCEDETYLDCIVRVAQASMAEGFRDPDLRALRREVFALSPQLLFRGHKDIAEMQANISRALRDHLEEHPERRLLPGESMTMEVLVATSAIASIMRIRLVTSVREDDVMKPCDARSLLVRVAERGL